MFFNTFAATGRLTPAVKERLGEPGFIQVLHMLNVLSVQIHTESSKGSSEMLGSQGVEVTRTYKRLSRNALPGQMGLLVTIHGCDTHLYCFGPHHVAGFLPNAGAPRQSASTAASDVRP